MEMLTSFHAEKEYIESLANHNRFFYNPKGGSDNSTTFSAASAYIIDLWANIKTSSDLDETEKNAKAFERLEIENLSDYLVRTRLSMKQFRFKEYYILLNILINSGIMSEKKFAADNNSINKLERKIQL